MKWNVTEWQVSWNSWAVSCAVVVCYGWEHLQYRPAVQSKPFKSPVRLITQHLNGPLGFVGVGWLWSIKALGWLIKRSISMGVKRALLVLRDQEKGARKATGMILVEPQNLNSYYYPVFQWMGLVTPYLASFMRIRQKPLGQTCATLHYLLPERWAIFFMKGLYEYLKGVYLYRQKTWNFILEEQGGPLEEGQALTHGNILIHFIGRLSLIRYLFVFKRW